MITGLAQNLPIGCVGLPRFLQALLKSGMLGQKPQRQKKFVIGLQKKALTFCKVLFTLP
jgi:hypothetical protein